MLQSSRAYKERSTKLINLLKDKQMNKHEFTIGQQYKNKQGHTLEVITVYTDSRRGFPLIMKDTESDEHWSFKLNGMYSTEASEHDLVLVPINQLNTTDTFVTFSGERITFRSAETDSYDFYEFMGTNNMYYSLYGKIFDNNIHSDCDIDFSATITASKQDKKEPKVTAKVNTNEINKDYTYITNNGEAVTFEDHKSSDPFYAFAGSNSYFYSKQGTIFEDEENYSNHDMDIDFTKTPTPASTLTQEKETQVVSQTSFTAKEQPYIANFIETLHGTAASEQNCLRFPEVTNTIKRKSKVDGIKRKIKIDRLSDDTIQVTIKTAYPELDKPLVTHFALTYEALDLFEEAIGALHEELEDEAEGFYCGEFCGNCPD